MSLLLHGDCLEHLKSVDSDSVDFIFCDLPYGQTNCKWDIIIPWEPFWKEIMRIKKLNTPIFFTTTTKFGFELMNNAPKKCPFRYDIVWVKSSPAGFLLSRKMPMRKHEMIYVFYEKLPMYDLSSHNRKVLKSKPMKSKNVSMYGKTKTSTTSERHYEPQLPNSILEVKSTRGKHSTEKPVALMSWLLKYYSKEGDTVLDPTMGSGSTGIACRDMNRNFIGIEKDPEIYEVAVNRIEN